MDFVYVNILNEGEIPYIRKKGPIFGYHMGVGVYSILARDPRVKIEKTTYENAVAKKAEYLEKKNEKIKIIQNIVEKEEKNQEPEIKSIVEKDPVDSEIDNILSEVTTTESSIGKNIYTEESKKTTEFRVYSNDELDDMTKIQLKTILKDRGYTSGVYAPKYHDSLFQLKTKVKKTQQL